MKPRYRLALLLLGGLLGLLFLVRVRVILFPFFLAVVIAYLLHPLVDWLERRRIRRVLAIMLIYLTLFGLLAVIMIFLVPLLVTQLMRLAESLPDYKAQIQAFIQSLQVNYSDIAIPESIRVIIDERLVLLEGQLLYLIRVSIENIFGLFSNLVNFIIAPVFAFYFLKDIDRIRRGFLSLIPASHKKDALALLGDIDRVIGGFIRGQLTVCVITGVLTGVGMRILGMRFPVLLGMIAGLTEIVPYFGPFLGAVPALMLALLRSPALALYVAATFALIQQVESTVIAPRIVSGHVGLHPLVVVFALLVGQELYGILGLLLAVPIAASLRVLLVHLARQLF